MSHCGKNGIGLAFMTRTDVTSTAIAGSVLFDAPARGRRQPAAAFRDRPVPGSSVFDMAISSVAILFWEYGIAAGVRRLAGDAVQRTKAARPAGGKIENRVRGRRVPAVAGFRPSQKSTTLDAEATPSEPNNVASRAHANGTVKNLLRPRKWP
jgi:hypothetical protein